MNFTEYQTQAMRTNDGKCTDRIRYAANCPSADFGAVINASLGLSGEVGELNDMIKKGIFHGHSLNTEHLKKEIGDVMWYLALMCDAFGFDMAEIAQMNINKLKARYPLGFDPDKSLHRKEGDI